MTPTSLPSAARTCLLVLSLTASACLGAEEASAVQLTASWVDNSDGVATTRLERRLGSAVAFAAVAEVPPGVTAYVDSSVSASTEYCYRALARDADGASPYSDESCATSAPDENPLNVTVSKAGAGAGIVASTPGGILCGRTCSATYPAGSAVTLNATPANGSTFTGWSGGCAGASACTVAGNAPVAVTATFTTATKSVAVSRAGDVSGTITSTPAGITCGTTCFATYPVGTGVTLTVIPATGSAFIGWSGGGCAGTGPCTPAGDASVSVTAIFAAVTQSITIVKAGDGAACSETEPLPRSSP